MIFVGVDLLENSITVWIRKLNLILNLQNLIHSGSNIDIERSYEHFFSIQKVLQLVVISSLQIPKMIEKFCHKETHKIDDSAVLHFSRVTISCVLF